MHGYRYVPPTTIGAVPVVSDNRDALTRAVARLTAEIEELRVRLYVLEHPKHD